MSFFFAPILPNSQNYCILMPILPCFINFSAQNFINLSVQQSKDTKNLHENCQIQIENDKETYKSKRSYDTNEEIQFLKIQAENSFKERNNNYFIQGKKDYQFDETYNQRLEESKKEVNQQIIKSRFVNKQTKIIKIKKSKAIFEDQYKPFQKKRKAQSYSRENQNRNIIPNEVNQIFSYIQKSSKSQFVVSRIFKKYPPSNNTFSIKKFYLYQNLLKQKISNYISQGSLALVTELYEPRCQIYSEQEQRYYNKVCRILIQHFLQQDSIFNILTSRRMHKDKKRNHLQMRRVLKQKVIKILRH